MPSPNNHTDQPWCLRLFLSVDIVGSTAYKASKSDGERWCLAFEDFYRNFPIVLGREYRTLPEWICVPNYVIPGAPAVWKLLGDEILFYVELKDYRDALAHVTAFIAALQTYSKHFADKNLPLSCKGGAWIGGFPVNNVMLDGARDSEGKTGPIDFIGRSIDCGFRLLKFSSVRKFVLSVDLTLLIADALKINNGYKGRTPLHAIRYDGRHELKGILGNKPYPIFWIDVNGEKVPIEDRWLGIDQNCSHRELEEFCDQFIRDNNSLIIRPFIHGDNGQRYSVMPEGYSDEYKARILQERREEPECTDGINDDVGTTSAVDMQQTMELKEGSI